MAKTKKLVPLLVSALLIVCAHAHADELTALFHNSVVFTNVGYSAGSTVISNFPLRVDVSSSRPNGFLYDGAGINASTVRFNFHDEYLDHATTAVVDVTVPYAVTNWNTEGVSTLYVQVPFWSNSDKARLTMHWDPVDYADLPENDPSHMPPAISNIAKSVEWNEAIGDQSTNANYIACAPAKRRFQHGEVWTTKLLNYWLVEPTISKRTWKQGEAQASIVVGTPASADPVISVEYFDRNTSTSLGTVQPLTPGAYRALVSVAETDDYAPLTKSLDFNIESAIVIGGLTTTNDFANCVKFSFSDEIGDYPFAASFNETRTKATYSKAVSTYSYKDEIKATGKVTIGCWFRADPTAIQNQPTTDQADKVQIIGLTTGGQNSRGPIAIAMRNVGTPASHSTLRLKVMGVGTKDGTTDTPQGRTIVAETDCPALADGQWHFVMATRDTVTGDCCLYFDGELLRMENHSGWVYYDDGAINNLAIACDPASPDHLGMSFIGEVAEAQLYDRILSSDEVSELFHSRMRLSGFEDGLLAYFPLNDMRESWTGVDAVLADCNKNGIGPFDIAVPGTMSWKEMELPFVGGPELFDGKPILIRLSSNSPRGFYFENLPFGATEESFYSDVRFFNEKGIPLDYEIETWDTADETLVWVNAPKVNGESAIYMCWGQGAGTSLPENDPSSVWEGLTPEQKASWQEYFKLRYNEFVIAGRVRENAGKQLQNRWITDPSMSMRQWMPGESAPVVNPGTTYGGAAKAYYYDRSTGAALSSLPVTRVGEYRAIFRFSPTADWSGLEQSIDFRIVKAIDTHDLGDASARVLLANNDGSVAGGEMYSQSYDDNEDGWGLPYWTHHEFRSDEDVSDLDPTKYFSEYNLFAGTCHEYMLGSKRLWGLVNVRFGNLFNNGRNYPGERGNAGLRPEQNYLPWNPQSERMLGYMGLQVGEYHRYAGTFLLQNVCDDGLFRYSQICSPCYDEGIGTIYFDIVNAFTNNVRDAEGGANYAVVVEIATNITDFVSDPPVDGVWPHGIWSASTEGEIFDPYYYADWHAVDMVPIRFRGDTGVDVDDCEQLPVTRELVLDITEGGSVTNFYRVYVPVNVSGKARFRIRRTRIDRAASFNPDADAYIIVDNLICSRANEAVQLVPYGWFDPDKHGKFKLGQEMAFKPAFPGINDAVYGRVKALDARGDEVRPGDVTAVTMHYRWRYLDQIRTDWMISDFYPSTLESIAPLTLPAGLPGDIEFWFEGSQNCGYYNYANYSGTKIGIPWYSEAYSLMTNGWDGVNAQWSIRIREGRSDWEQAVLVVRDPDGGIEEVKMALAEDHQWRGYYMTTNPIPEGVDVRVELRNYQEPGAKIWSLNTNRYCLVGSGITPPYSGRMQPCGEDGWTHIPVDAYTGYLMFQADDKSMGLSVVRADYQNFNHWTDGYGDKFVGSGAADLPPSGDHPISGVSPLTRDFTADYTTNYVVSVATNQLWMLDFETRNDYVYYKTFPQNTETVNGWDIGKGRFVYGAYRDSSKGTALQMAGCGEGWVEMSNRAIGLWPRGVEKVTFNGSIAQTIEFGDFSYREEIAATNNYCIRAEGAFDLEENESFTGNASLSLIGYYRDSRGCYELRFEQERGSIDTYGTVTGPKNNGQRLSIYRWNKKSGSEKAYDVECLCTLDMTTAGNYKMPVVTRGTSIATAVSNNKLMPMSLAVYERTKDSNTGTMIVVGVCANESGNGNGNYWRFMGYFDCSDKRLKSGSYGVLTANSGGYIMSPRVAPVTNSSEAWGLTLPGPNASANKKDSKATHPIAAAKFVSCWQDLEDWWALPGRNVIVNESSHVYGFKAADAWQTVNLVGLRGASDEEVLKTYMLSNSWGKIKAPEAFGADIPLLWRTKDASFRLVTGGDLDGQRTDVIIDNVKVHQWRGKNEIVLYEDGDDPDNPNDYLDDKCAHPVNANPEMFVYTSGWISNSVHGATALELCAKRTIPGRPAGVRTPLMDGLDGRGSGIGNIAFSYRNCQTNVALLVQVATNVFRGNLAELTRNTSTSSTPGSWSTVARLTYDDLGSAGSTNIAFGLRIGQKGYGAVARVILDPDLVLAVSNATDVASFGSIQLLRVSCQDEPPIDKGCWWGWNLRTLGDIDDLEKRMYLPDADEYPSPGFSLALNSSVTEDIDVDKKKEYTKHMPFVQSPTFTNQNVIGEVSFRARKYDNSGYTQYAELGLYGIPLDKIAQGRDQDWELLARFIVSNTVFTTYSFRVADEGSYAAVRLGVTGVKGVNPISRGPNPVCGDDPVRVLLDEVTVSEAVYPELAVRDIGAFRYDMMATEAALNVPSRQQQPLCREGWGVQCELFAVMLEDQIDTRHPPKVKLHWYKGASLWGYDQWKDSPDAHSGWLARATDTDALIFRSSYASAPEAVIPQSSKDEEGDSPVVQYVLEIFYTVVDDRTGTTTQRSRIFGDDMGEWEVPEWYAPVDFNTDRDYGKGEHWSCFCILDDIAPGWAWINEVNIFGGLNPDGYNLDENCQFVEVAAPVTADLSGWRIEMVQAMSSSGKAITNTVAVFGERGLSSTKSLNEISNYVFHVVANPATGSSFDRSIFNALGTLDGTWLFDYRGGYLFNQNHTLNDTEPVGIRLVRPNGIVEHEVVTVGEDIWGGSYSPDATCTFLNSVTKPGKFFYPDQDNQAGDHSVGVVNGQGEHFGPEYVSNWNNTMRRTPGVINEGQQINPDIPVPYGEMIYIFSQLDQSGGNIWQSNDGGVSFTNTTMRFFVRRGSQLGTNVTFKVEPWYQIESSIQTCDGKTVEFNVTSAFNKVDRTLTLALGKGCSNTVNVITKACLDRQLAQYDIDENNPYTPAIIKWLQDGETLRGPFLNNDGIIRLGEFWGKRSGYIADLTLTEMYWLDIDPTAGEMVLRGGWGDPPTPKLVDDESGNKITNDVMSVFMMITNKTDSVGSPLYGQAWTPYVLRSIEPTKTSWDYDSASTSDWVSVTFKIKGILLNGHTSIDNPDNWVDLRWFVFHPDSFHQPGNALGAEPFTADVEILDPMHRYDSPGYDAGWLDYAKDSRPDIRPYYRWDINTRIRPTEIEVLKTNNVTVVTAP